MREERAVPKPSESPLFGMRALWPGQQKFVRQAQAAALSALKPVETASEREAAVLERAAPMLAKMERYERRAFSRRKSPIRVLGAARAERHGGT